MRQRNQSIRFFSFTGFTLVELLAVMVILSIVAAISSQFIVSAVDSYRSTELRSKLIAKGRVAIEQMTRQLRNAAPHSLRISSSGNCLEFLPLVAGANYIDPVADAENGRVSTGTIETSAFTLGLGSARHALVSALSPAEIYTNGQPSGRADVLPLASGIAHESVVLSSTNRFHRNSIQKRLFITDDPQRFCVTDNQLLQYRDYGLNAANIDDGNPGGTSMIIANGVNAANPTFTLSPGSEDRNTAIAIAVAFSDRNESITLTAKVLVRNVP